MVKQRIPFFEIETGTRLRLWSHVKFLLNKKSNFPGAWFVQTFSFCGKLLERQFTENCRSDFRLLHYKAFIFGPTFSLNFQMHFAGCGLQ